MKRRFLAGDLNFTAFFDPGYAKRQLLLLASLDQVEVAHFKNLK
jgi:hypothetical protein